MIRSGQTLSYYRDLLAACERHLRGMDAEDMAQSLGWAIRLLRYYRAVPDAAELVQQSNRPSAQPGTTPTRPIAPTIPSIGDTFAGKITAVDETVVLIGITGFAENQAIGVLKAEVIPDGRTDHYRIGNSARVEVIVVHTLKSGRVIVELKPGAKRS